ncbi:MAG: hypothetical protein H5T50_10485 [Nitrososphaeria archaeon]|nr:hypothetical protein [Nitrososphaeria archaeon]
MGEWPFWLNKHDLEQKFAIVLYRLEDWVQVMLDTTLDVKGVANIIFLNMSRNSLTDYVVGNVNLPNYMQIFNDKSIFPQEIIIPEVDEGTVEKIVEERKLALEQICQCCGNKKLIESMIFPETYKYYNGTLKINSELLIKNLDFRDKPFKYLDSLLTRKEVWRGKNFQVDVYTVYKGVEYDGKKYVTPGFIGLKNVIYSSNGVLLYIGVEDSIGMLTSVLPTFVIRAFGLIPESIANGGEISLKLIETNLL